MLSMARKKKKTRGQAGKKAAGKRLSPERLPEFELAQPQASTLIGPRELPGWRDVPRAVLQYRIYAGGNFEVRGKIRSPEELVDGFARLAEILNRERLLERHRRSSTRIAARRPPAPDTPGLFGGTDNSLAVKLKDIRPL